MVYSGFENIRQAKKFENIYTGCKDGYNIKITASGSGKNSIAHIEKQWRSLTTSRWGGGLNKKFRKINCFKLKILIYVWLHFLHNI